MGAYCRICGCVRRNEAFSGRGRRKGICKKCQQMPKVGRQRIADEIFLAKVLEQGNISEKNIKSLKEMSLRSNGTLRERATALAELGLVHPGKKKRYGYLYHRKPELYARMVRLGMIEDWIKLIDFYEER